MNDELTFPFLVPDPEAAAPPPADGFGEGDAGLERQWRAPPFLGGGKRIELTRRQLEDFWKEKVVGLAQTLSDAQAAHEAKGFRVEEIAFALGVGAKGGIAFVAEASAEASITVTLKRL
jgi:Trypsin-co-occurring domain 1